MRVVFRPEARAEAIEARDWYEARARGLGADFVDTLEAAITAASKNSEAFAVVHGNFRRVILRKFPYSLVLRREADRIVVFAVFHHRRRPRTGSPA